MKLVDAAGTAPKVSNPEDGGAWGGETARFPGEWDKKWNAGRTIGKKLWSNGDTDCIETNE